MWMVLLTYQLASFSLTYAQNGCSGEPTFRSPANSDIDVSCGAQTIDISILMCPIYFNGYNESMLAFNSEHSKPECHGVADWTVDPPVVRFNFSITEEGINSCSSSLTVYKEQGTGLFSEFSTVEFVNISGMLCSEDPHGGAITYHQEVMYRFSCRYALQYLINNTQMSVSGVNLAIRENNGSFISTLSMQLYEDNSYSSLLRIPQQGLELKTRIFVEVRASNLSNRFNVLLDRCYATTSPFLIETNIYDLFVGCHRDGQTVIARNGVHQEARFSFEAFRFVDNTTAVLSTYYVHCATRLCVNAICPSLIQRCGLPWRRRRATDDGDTTVSDSTTVTSGRIVIRLDNDLLSGLQGHQKTHQTVVVVSVIAGIIGAICLTLAAFVFYQNYNSRRILNNTILDPRE